MPEGKKKEDPESKVHILLPCACWQTSCTSSVLWAYTCSGVSQHHFLVKRVRRASGNAPSSAGTVSGSQSEAAQPGRPWSRTALTSWRSHAGTQR